MTDPGAKLLRAALWVVLGAFGSVYVTDTSAQHAEMDHSAHRAMAGPASMTDGASQGIVVDFELVDRDGRLVSDEDFRGRYVLLGFGFTHCEHICPLMALNMGRAVHDSPKPATGIFVSVDTERDTPAISDDYATHFGESMLGLGGSIEQINSAAKNFKVSYVVTKTQDAYTVQHTANVFLIDPDGALAKVFSFSTAPDVILEAIKQRVAGSATPIN